MRDSQTDLLIQAVSRLTVAVEKLDSLLRDEYPKRSEVERTYVSKHQNQTLIVKMVVVALVTVVSTLGLSVGVYAKCFVGDSNPSICATVPGFNSRVVRKDEIDNRLDKLEQELATTKG